MYMKSPETRPGLWKSSVDGLKRFADRVDVLTMIGGAAWGVFVDVYTGAKIFAAGFLGKEVVNPIGARILGGSREPLASRT